MCEEERKLRRVLAIHSRYYEVAVKAQNKRKEELAGYIIAAKLEIMRYNRIVEGVLKLCLTGK